MDLIIQEREIKSTIIHFMIPGDEIQVPDNHDANHLVAIGQSVDHCMKQYHPYLRPDLSLEQLSVITNIPVSQLEIYFSQRSIQSFNYYLNGWRIKHAKNLINTGKARDMELKTIGAVSGFSSARKFSEAFIHIEGISPETYQSHIDTSKPL